MMKKNLLYTLSACTLLAGASQAATIVNTYDPGQFNADVGTVDATGLSYIQSFTAIADFTGDGIDDTLDFSVVTANDDGITDFNANGMWYDFAAGGATYTMSLGAATLTTVDPDYVSVSLDMSLESIFSSKNYRGSVTDGAATIAATANFQVATPTDNTTGDPVTALTGTSFDWTTTATGSDGTRALALDFVVSTIVIPEPSSYALLAGLLGLSAVMLRRRQA
jgi:hypothetical protein